MPLLRAILAATLAVGAASAAGGQAQLLPHGEFAARDGRPGPERKWRLDDAAGRAVVDKFNRIAAASEILLDYDHQTMFVTKHGQLAPAAGWMLSAEWRDGQGMFATVNWTTRAKGLLAGGEYRFVSPVIEYDEATGDITAVLMASLVNYPALLGMSPAVAQLASQFPNDSTEHTPMNPILKALLAALGLTETATQEQAMAAFAAVQTKPAALTAGLAGALGVATGADEATALAAVTALKKAGTVDIATVAALQGEIAALRGKVNGDQVTRIVDAAIAAHKLMPSVRQWALDLGASNIDQLNALIIASPVMPLGQQSREGGHDDGAAGDGGLSSTQTMLAGQLGLDPVKYAAHIKATAAAAAKAA